MRVVYAECMNNISYTPRTLTMLCWAIYIHKRMHYPSFENDISMRVITQQTVILLCLAHPVQDTWNVCFFYHMHGKLIFNWQLMYSPAYTYRPAQHLYYVHDAANLNWRYSKLCESSMHALFLYNCTPRTSCSAYATRVQCHCIFLVICGAIKQNQSLVGNIDFKV